MKRNFNDIIPALSLSNGFLILFIFSSHVEWIYAALTLFFVSLLVPKFAKVVSIILKTTLKLLTYSIFYFLTTLAHFTILSIIGFLKRFFIKDTFYSGASPKSNFINCEKEYSKEFFEKMG